MPTLLYCWRCKADVAMLDEAEWAVIHPLLLEDLRCIKRYRNTFGATLPFAIAQVASLALDAYVAMTGFPEKNPENLWHHRRSVYGPPCHACGKPLRTPRARFCAECGARPCSVRIDAPNMV